MKKNHFRLAIFFTFLSITIMNCTVLQVTERGKNGYFQANFQAKFIENKDINLDTMKSLVVVPTSEFMLGMTKNLNYFDKVISIEDFEKDIIKANKQDAVGDISGLIGLNKAYKHYQKYLWLNFERKGSDPRKMTLRLKLTNPGTLDDIFVAEIPLESPTIGSANDQNTFYPLFNKLVDYIKLHSSNYK